MIPDVNQPERSTARCIQAASVAGGLLILLMRPAMATAMGWTVPTVTVIFAAVMLLGIAAPIEHDHSKPPTSLATLLGVAAVGMLAFLSGRLLAAGHAPVPASGLVIGLNTLAAVAEEALFRRVAFAALLPAGAVWAVAGTSLLFGLAHVTVYGWWAFPLDAAAGAVLGWQRWASDSWTVPAATHALADLLVVI